MEAGKLELVRAPVNMQLFAGCVISQLVYQEKKKFYILKLRLS